MSLLELRNVSAGYGQVEVLHGVSLTVEPGEVVALLGANGAGKTTTLRTISGTLKLRSGEVWFDGVRIDELSPRQVVCRGLVQVPEARHIFPGLTVRDNLLLGMSNRGRVSRSQAAADVDEQLRLFPVLRDRADALGWALSGGQQQMLAIARGLIAKPRLLLIDEASLGLAPVTVKQVLEIVREIRRRGTTVLLVEQNAAVALSLADRGYVLETGELALEGTAGQLSADVRVSHAYLGGSKA
jgi:branched-chain amino acid transport system ATP-binding protein